ncbi:hypothetical protein NP493_204g01001 [Ridgeia piscesae]|uniref:Uncharacterized protein n=1 Tax=Ridgeia piscesae TaxID=27915 RepID=A0AAD9P140_RIDPI|nr:hypothetical protein NP493_204g01001 [Ridgeia piscesae]
MVVPYSGFVWQDMPCAFSVGYVCETDVGTKLCAEGSSHYDEVLVVGRRCFLVKNTEVSWFLAREICEKAGAKLATIDRQEIQDRLTRASPGTNAMVNGYWVGLRRVEWTWISGDEIEYPYWESSQPSRHGSCVRMEKFDSETYLWGNWNCLEQLRYVCELDISDETPTIITEATSMMTSVTTSDTRVSSTATSRKTYHSTSRHVTLKSTSPVPVTTAVRTKTPVATSPKSTSPVPVTTIGSSQTESPPAREVFPRACRYIDIAVILDVSGSETNSAKAVSFIASLFTQYNVSSGCVRVSVMTTSSANSGGILFHLNSHNDTDALLGDIRGLSWNDQSDSVFTELRAARRDVFTSANGDRRAATNIIVLVTDGDSPEGYSGDEVVQALKENITVVVVAVDCNAPVRNHLAAITSAPSEKHLIDVDSFESLPNALGRLSKLILFYSSEGPFYDSYTRSNVVDGTTTLAQRTTRNIPVTPTVTAADATNDTSSSTTVGRSNGANKSVDDDVTWRPPEVSMSPPGATPNSVTGGRMGPYPVLAISLAFAGVVIAAAVIIFVMVVRRKKRSTKYTHYGGQFRAAVVATSPKLSRSPSSPSSTASQSSDNSRFNLDNVTTPWGTMGSWRKSTKSTCRPSVGACLPNSDQPPNTLFYNCWSIPADNNVSSANTR